MTNDDRAPNDERRYRHIVTVWTASAGMIGVCLTAIGLVGIMHTLRDTQGYIEEMLAVASLLFLITTILCYIGARFSRLRSGEYFVIALDIFFCCGLLMVITATVLLAWFVL